MQLISEYKKEINGVTVVAMIMAIALLAHVWDELQQLWQSGLKFQFFLTDLFAVALTVPPVVAFIFKQLSRRSYQPDIVYALAFLGVGAFASISGVAIGRIKIQMGKEGGGLETQIGYSIVYFILPALLSLLYVW